MSTAVYFDLDGTLVRFSAPYERLFERAIAAANETEIASDGAFETYSETFFAHFHDHRDDPYLAGMRAVCETYSFDADPESLRTAIIDAEIAGSAINESVVDLLSRLPDRYRVGVLSNGVGSVQRRKLRRHGLLDRFEPVLVSYELGVHKPDPEIFAAAMDRLPADRYVYVADNFEEDLEPARNAGFSTIRVADDASPPVEQARSIGLL